MKDKLYEDFNVLVVGAGTTGERHALAQQTIGAQVTLYDTDFKKAQDKADRLGISSTKDLEGAISDTNLVYVCTPAFLHTKVAKTAIRAGKDVFCEKPLTTNLSEAQDLEKLVRQFGTRFIVGHYVRLESSFSEARKISQSDEFGRITSMYASYLQNINEAIVETPWRKFSSLLFDGGSHAVDTVCWIAGEPVKSVSAVTSRKVDPTYPNPEKFRLFLKFQSDLAAQVWINAKAPTSKAGINLSVAGEYGVLKTHHKWDHIQLINNNGIETSRLAPWEEHPVDGVARIINGYLTGRFLDYDPLPNIHEAMQIMRVLDAAQRSIKSHVPIQF